MKNRIYALLPHAPQTGLYVSPDIPATLLRNALQDYAPALSEDEVHALYDATLLGNGKDGALFTDDRLIFQNNNIESIHVVRYVDIVDLDVRRKLLGGQRIVLSVNRGHATFDLTLDFSGRPRACPYVARFLREATLYGEDIPDAGSPSGEDVARTGSRPDGSDHSSGRGRVSPGDSRTDPDEVRTALDALHARGVLSTADRRAMLEVAGIL